MYIKQEDRLKYKPFIDNVLGLIPQDIAFIKQAERFSYFLDVLLISLTRPRNTRFGESFGWEAKLKEHAGELANVLPLDMDNQADPLNYVISSIAWGLCGDALGRNSARYCLRSYIKGALWRVLLSNVNKAFLPNEYIFFTGVITDVIDEMYRRRTAPFENGEILECGDLWSSDP